MNRYSWWGGAGRWGRSGCNSYALGGAVVLCISFNFNEYGYWAVAVVDGEMFAVRKLTNIFRFLA